MLKKHMAACLFATAFVAAPVLAQTSPAPPPSGATDRPAASASGAPTTGSSAMQPSTSSGAAGGGGSAMTTTGAPGAAGSSGGAAPTAAPAAGTGGATTAGSSAGGATGTGSGGTAGASGSGTAGSSSATSGGMSGSSAASAGSTTASSSSAAPSQGNFTTQLQGQQMMASKLIGTTVISANNESVGDVNDVILDGQGKAMAVVIGVGGFLGIGEKDVAVPFDRLDFNPPQQTSANAGSGSNSAATTGSTGGSSAATAGNRPNNREGGVPDRIMLRMSKADLQSAPSFRISGNAAAGSQPAGSAGAQAPKQ